MPDAFVEERFPVSLSYGSVGGPSFQTNIVVNDGGQETRVARWSQPRWRYDVSYGIRDLADLATIYEFYIARQGPLIGFRFKDWFDYTTASDNRSAPSNTDVVIGDGDGVTTVFQLRKAYASAAGDTIFRTISKPVTGTTVVAVDGVAQTAGVDFTVNTSTGEITFAVAPADATVITAGCEFDVPARFEGGSDESLRLAYENVDLGAINGIPVISLPEGTAIQSELYYGGAKEVSMSANISVSPAEARVWVLAPTTSGLSVTLPSTAEYPPGHGHLYIINDGGDSIDIKDSGGSTVLTVAAGAGAELMISIAVGGGRTWYAK